MPRFDVWSTPIGDHDLRALTGPHRAAAKAKLRELEARGCAAAGYRLQGAGVERVCAVHLSDRWRMLTAYPALGEVCVLLVGRHDHQHRDVDVYLTLYAALGLEDWPVGDPNHPQACFDEGEPPPVDEELVTAFIGATSSDVRRRVRDQGRRRRDGRRG